MPKYLITSTAANVRAEVARRRIPQRVIADHLGLNQQQVSRRLNGDVEFTVSELQGVATLLGVAVADLIEQVPA